MAAPEATLGLYATFFGGGIFAAIDPFRLRPAQITAQIAAPLKSTGSSTVATWWNSVATGLSEWAGPAVAQQLHVCGSSAGVAALSGCCFMVACHDIFFGCRDRDRDRGNRRRTILSQPLGVFAVGLAAARHAGYVWAEFEAVRTGVTPWGVDHAAHVSGFLFGVATGVSLMVAEK